MSPYLCFEIISVYERLNNPKEDVEKLKLYLETQTIKIIPRKKINVCRDKKDNQILALCLAGDADFLITGDKDLLSLKKFGDTKILKPKEFLKLLWIDKINLSDTFSPFSSSTTLHFHFSAFL